MAVTKIWRGVAILSMALPTLATADEIKPVWEAGAGIAVFSFPAYRGSDQRQNFAMPVPFFTYHGDFLKADRHGIRGSLFDSDLVDLTLSFSASPPANSRDITARSGMPDLKPTAEFGPQVDLTLWRSENRDRFLKLRMPIRAGFTLEPSPQNVGWIFSPNLNLDVTDIPYMEKWNLGLVAGPIFASGRQHEHFYNVAPQYATNTRPAYTSSGGYSGTQFLVAFSKRFANTWVGAFVRYDTLNGAVFEDSPLVTQKNFVAAGVAISWVLGESKTRVWINE